MKTLTAEQQASLVAASKAGDRKATADLLHFCDRDIQAMVSKAKHSHREDLAQVGRITVLKAIQKFDPTAGKQFRFYAAQWVREDIRRHAANLSSVVVRNVRTMSTDVYFDAPVLVGHTDADETTLLDLTASDSPDPEASLIQDSDAERLRQVLESIIRRLRVKAESRYDRAGLCRDLVYSRLLSDNPVNLETLSQRYQVARETVRKLEVLVIARAKRELEGT